MLPFLKIDSHFPAVSSAREDPNGLLAAGADLSSARLLEAYQKGIFPWYSEGEPILWWSPNPRMVLEVSAYRPSRSLLRFIKKHSGLKVTINRDFKGVIEECARPAKNRESTWIVNDIKQAYLALHNLGRAHSLEIWQQSELVGGIYGINVGNIFCGESMFGRISNGSKIALSCLAAYLKLAAFDLIDCQIANPHLVSLGAINITRENYIERLNAPTIGRNPNRLWQSQSLSISQLLAR